MNGSFCQYYNAQLCNSCEWLEIPYETQLLKKEKKAKLLLGVELEETVSSPLQGFRNKIKISVTGTVESPILGIIGRDNLDQGQDLTHCPIQHPKLNLLLQKLSFYIQEFNLIPYQIHSKNGELKGIIAFYSETSHQIYLRFILRSKECISRIIKMIPKLQLEFPEVVCISANLQPIPHAILEGEEEIILTQTESIDYPLGKELPTLSLSPKAFVQTNTTVALQLYETASRWIKEASQSKPIKMLELFSGQGSFSFAATHNTSQILGIEINKNAVKTANLTAEKYNLNHVHFDCIDLNLNTEAALFKKIEDFHPHLILANPPRKGLSKSIDLILKSKPDFLVYSSCSIDSLAEDMKKLSESYLIKRVQIFDLFPHTEHFEILIWMELK